MRRALDHLPKGLDETYDRILKGIPQEKQDYAQCLLKCVAVSIRPLILVGHYFVWHIQVLLDV